MSTHFQKSRILLCTAVLAIVVIAVVKWSSLADIPILSNNNGRSVSNRHHVCEPIPKDSVLQTMTREQVAQHYHNYVNSVQISCKTIIRHGNVGDGGWDVCIDPGYNIQKPCIIYSFGINNDWSFDDSVALKYGCEVHSYDPSMKNVKDHDRKPNLHFHKTGLNTTDETNKYGWRMRTFKSILKENGHSEARVDLLKIDIDYSEWWAFPEMLRSGSLNNVKQFCFEIHVKLNSLPEPSKEMYIMGLNLLREFYHAGFRIFRTHKNMDARFRSVFGMERTGCHEIYLIKNDTLIF